MKIWNPIITLIELRSNQNVMTRNRERCHAQATIATSWPLNPMQMLKLPNLIKFGMFSDVVMMYCID